MNLNLNLNCQPENHTLFVVERERKETETEIKMEKGKRAHLDHMLWIPMTNANWRLLWMIFLRDMHRIHNSLIKI